MLSGMDKCLFPEKCFSGETGFASAPFSEIQKLYKDTVELEISCEKEEKSYAELEGKVLDLSLTEFGFQVLPKNIRMF